jgi:hypothetical protein
LHGPLLIRAGYITRYLTQHKINISAGAASIPDVVEKDSKLATVAAFCDCARERLANRHTHYRADGDCEKTLRLGRRRVDARREERERKDQFENQTSRHRKLLSFCYGYCFFLGFSSDPASDSLLE